MKRVQLAGMIGLVMTAVSTMAQSDTYMVIDVSDGPSASNYPVSYTNEAPLGGWTNEYKTTRIVLRKIPAGTFTMGAPEGEIGQIDSEYEAQHQVTLTEDFYIGVFEVTQQQWERVMGDWPSHFTDSGLRESYPVEQVSYYDIRENPANSAISPNWPASDQVHADSFMGTLRAKTGLARLDLPTEAQWEYACRAGTTTALNSGKNLTSETSCTNMSEVGRYYHNGAPWMATVGLYLQNAWGLYDMHGNVYEWCLDWDGMYSGPATNPAGASSGSHRMHRGGYWQANAGYCRSGVRPHHHPSERNRTIGFRLARTLPNFYTLTVVGGTGGGAYTAGTEVAVTADEPPAGQAFNGWTLSPEEADLGELFDGSQASTTAIMPAYAVTLSANYADIPTVAAPAFDPDGGEHSGESVDVTITCTTPDATIRYTTNGSDPTESSATVTSGSSVSVPVPGTLKAKAWKTGMNPSVVKSASYTATPQPPPAPVSVSASDGKYKNKITVEWAVAAGAADYQIFRHTSDNSAAAEEVGTSSTTTYGDTTAMIGKTYYYWVKAVNAAGASDFSACDTGYLGVVGPLVTVNNMVGENIRIPAADPVSIAVEMMNLPVEYLGLNIDWWVAAYVHDGGLWFYFDSAFNLTPFDGNPANCHPAYQGPLYEVPSQTLVENMFLPPGTYNVWFAVDYPMDGVLNLTPGYHLMDSVTVVVE